MRNCPTRNHWDGIVFAAVCLAGLCLAASFAANAWCDEPPPDRNPTDRVAEALKRGLPLVAKAAANYPQHRKCFSCHHQTLPLLAITAAEGAGVSVDKKEVVALQADFTHASFVGQLEALREGKGIGGRALTVGYGLWTLRLAGRPANETTDAMVTFLLKTQLEDGHWEPQTSRPPMEDSLETCTTLAIVGLRSFAAGEHKEPGEAAVAKAKAWLQARAPQTQEDKIFRLWSLVELSCAAEESSAAQRAVLESQRDDGGWAQKEGMESDAYATGQTLFLLQATGLTATAEPYRRGVEFLLKTQGADGSWHVKTRSDPIQVYFDNGDPHGKDQFISTPATCWALAALAASRKRAD